MTARVHVHSTEAIPKTSWFSLKKKHPSLATIGNSGLNFLQLWSVVRLQGLGIGGLVLDWVLIPNLGVKYCFHPIDIVQNLDWILMIMITIMIIPIITIIIIAITMITIIYYLGKLE